MENQTQPNITTAQAAVLQADQRLYEMGQVNAGQYVPKPSDLAMPLEGRRQVLQNETEKSVKTIKRIAIGSTVVGGLLTALFTYGVVKGGMAQKIGSAFAGLLTGFVAGASAYGLTKLDQVREHFNQGVEEQLEYEQQIAARALKNQVVAGPSFANQLSHEESLKLAERMQQAQGDQQEKLAAQAALQSNDMQR